jgi:hypothetical protein
MNPRIVVFSFAAVAASGGLILPHELGRVGASRILADFSSLKIGQRGLSARTLPPNLQSVKSS